MELWVGPVIIAAAVSALVSIANWFVTSWQSEQSEQRRRDERIRDFQIALRAEIRAELKNLERYDLDAHLAEIETRYRAEAAFSVSVPPVARHLVFEAIVGQIHILPEAVIDPVVLYARQRQAVESLVDAMRDQTFRTLSPERQLQIYRDYIGMWRSWRDLADQAERALTQENINSPVEDRSSP